MITALASLLGITPKLTKIGLGIVAALAIAAVLFWLDAREQADDRRNQDLGASVQREGDLRHTLERTEQGNEARAEIEEAFDRNNGRSCVTYHQCLQTARTPGNCKRLLPERGEDEC